MNSNKQQKRIRRHNRVRAKIKGTSKVPRLCVFRSNQHITAQVIDDEKRKTIIFATDNTKSKENKVKKAFEVGKEIAKLAVEKKVKKVVFDRGGYLYTGSVSAVADGAREAGLKF